MGDDGDSCDSKVAGGAASPATIHIRCSNGSQFSVQTALDAVVSVFKGLLSEKCDVPAEQQRLIYMGRILKDDKTLESYGLESDHTIHLVRGVALSNASNNTAASPGALPRNIRSQITVRELVIDNPSLLLRVSVTSLKKLTICNNDVLQSFTIDVERWFMDVSSYLCELSFSGLKSLQSLPSSLERFSSLKILRVEKVPQLQQLPHIPDSLEELHLKYLKSLRCLPWSLSDISSPKFLLHLESIPLLKTLPDLPSSLETLVIENCNPELMKRYKELLCQY